MHILLNNTWYSLKKTPLAIFLFPFSLLYRLIMRIRRWLYQINILKHYRAPVPVVVVGNITVGGTGKTPFVIALVTLLKNNGYHPGVMTRGYGAKQSVWPQIVTAQSDAIQVGDEAVLIARKTNVPVIAGPNRSDSAKKLVDEFQCNVIVSDDGLQHYALSRDIEIALIDATRRFGNGFCLPAGPLREPCSRLKTVNFIITNGQNEPNEYSVRFVLNGLVNLIDANKKIALIDLQKMQKKITVVAGIANPQRFFDALRLQSIVFEEKIFADHHAFVKTDFDTLSSDMIIMTEKDAVKCISFADERFWAVEGHSEFNSAFITPFIQKLSQH